MAESGANIRGRVKWYNPVTGHGVLSASHSGDQYFFHRAAIHGAPGGKPERGQKVWFRRSRIVGIDLPELSTPSPASLFQRGNEQGKEELYGAFRACRDARERWLERRGPLSALRRNEEAEQALCELLAAAMAFIELFERNRRAGERMAKERGIYCDDYAATGAFVLGPKLVFGDFATKTENGRRVRYWKLDKHADRYARLLRWLDNEGCSGADVHHLVRSFGGFRQVARAARRMV